MVGNFADVAVVRFCDLMFDVLPVVDGVFPDFPISLQLHRRQKVIVGSHHPMKFS